MEVTWAGEIIQNSWEGAEMEESTCPVPAKLSLYLTMSVMAWVSAAEPDLGWAVNTFLVIQIYFHHVAVFKCILTCSRRCCR